MSFIRPNFRHPETPKNDLGFTRKDYEGRLQPCAGCGHDSISAAIINACFELSIEPIKWLSYPVLVVPQNPDLR